MRIVATFDHTDLDEAGVVSALADIRGVQRVLDGLVARLSIRADTLAENGSAAPGPEVLRGSGAVSAHQARLEARRAMVTKRFPALGEALSAARTTGAHLDAIADATRDLTDHQIAALDAMAIADSACSVPVEVFRKSLRRKIDDVVGDNGLDDAIKKQTQTRLRWRYDHRTGMGLINGQFDPEAYETLINAIDHHMTAMTSRTDEPITKDEHLAARALVDLVDGSGDGGGGGGAGEHATRRRLPSITVVVDAQTMAEGPRPGSVRQTETGSDLAAETISRLCCDAVLRRVTLDESGVPINVGRKYRTATDAQWAAIKAIHHSCAWVGCDAPITWTQLHHIHHWQDGGPTDLDNLIPLCSRHHHRVHEGKWHIKLLPDRTLKIYKPDGGHHATVQPPLRC